MNNIENHDQNFFCISKRTMSFVSSGFIIILFLAFMMGYVWGKRVALEDIIKAVEQKTFADQISGSLYAISTRDSDSKKEDSSDVNTVIVNTVGDTVAGDLSSIVVDVEPQVAESSTVDHKEKGDQGNSPVIEKNNQTTGNYCYYAQLIGFSSKKAAEQFVALLKNNPLDVAIKERVSVGGLGKKKVWYQVVTQRYTDKEELERLVAHVVKKERLSGVQIIPC